MTEYFFTSQIKPRILLEVNLLVARLRVWGPYPFVSLSVGPLWRSENKVKALQMYFGIKADGTRTYARHGAPEPSAYEMVLTPKELAAVRIHGSATTAHWNDQGGS